MIFNAIKNLFNKDENTEQIEYLGTDKDGNKINMWRADNIKDALRGIK